MKKTLLLFAVLLVSFQLNAQWVTQTSGVTGNLMSVSAIDNNTCWIGGATGIVLRTTNGGTTWTNVGGGAVIGTANDVSTVFAWDANNCLATTSSAAATFVYKTTNGGTTWTQVFTQALGFIDGIFMTSATNGFMDGDPVNNRWSLWRTTDGGTTWDSTGLNLIRPGTTEAGWNNGIYMSGNSIWFGTNNTKVYYSTNNGSTWATQVTGTQANSYSIWFNGNTGFTGGTSSLVKTTNLGTAWAQFTQAPTPGSIFGVYALGNTWLYSTSAGAIYQSTDNGATFAKVDSVTGNIYYAIGISRTGNTAWACAGATGQIRKGTVPVVPVELTSFTATSFSGTVNLNWSTATETNNRGFEVQRKAAGADFVNVAFINGKGTTTEKQNYSYSEKVQAGKYTYRLRQVDYDGRSEYFKGIEVDVTVPLTFALNQNYPNPFNPSTSFTYSIAKSGLVKIAVYNTLGQQVKELVNEVKDAGIYNVSFNASSLSSGTYFYKIETAQFSQVKKMLLLK